jgi:ribosomal protein S18 acetylase RimI-like enzyme
MQIVMAAKQDKDEILKLYKAQFGREFCPWTEGYPSEETIDIDLSRDALFVMKEDDRIVAAISLEEDEDVDNLSCWDKTLAPEGEVARVAVLPEAQNKGLGRIMMQYAMDELKRRGYNGIHILVNKHNIKAIRCYEVFGFRTVGECYMYEQDFFCYEREL